MPTIDRSKILGIDTTTNTIVLSLGTRLVEIPANRQHSAKLLPAIDKLLLQQKVEKADLAGVVVVIGPGSFTSLRVGVVVANGIGYGLNKPVRGVDEFTRIQYRYPQADAILLNAGRGEVFAKFRGAAAPSLIAIDKLQGRIQPGDTVYVDTAELLALVHVAIRAAGTIYIGVANLAERMQDMVARAKLGSTFKQVEPLYLRGANIGVRKKA